jgi:hypothetical protein
MPRLLDWCIDVARHVVGVVRHYWVLIALVLSTLALLVSLLHMPTVTQTADLARAMADTATLGGDILHPRLASVSWLSWPF